MTKETFTDEYNTWQVEWEGETGPNGSGLVCSVMTPRRGRRFVVFVRGRNRIPWLCSYYYAKNVHPEALVKLKELNDAERAIDGRGFGID